MTVGRVLMTSSMSTWDPVGPIDNRAESLPSALPTVSSTMSMAVGVKPIVSFDHLFFIAGQDPRHFMKPLGFKFNNYLID